MKKNIVYLTLDDLKKLYDIDPKLIKKIKKKRKRRRKLKKKLGESIKFDKIKEGSMQGVTYSTQPLTRNTSTIDIRDAEILKEQIKAIKDKEKNNPLLLTDVPPNLVGNDNLLKEIENIKKGINIMYKEGAETFNYLFDNIGDVTYKNKPINYDELDRNERVNNNLTNPVYDYKYDGDDLSIYTDNVGDFTNTNTFNDPIQIEEEKQIKNSLSQISGSTETPPFVLDIEINPLFYQEQSDVLQPVEQSVEKTIEPTIEPTIEQTIEQPIVKPIEEATEQSEEQINPPEILTFIPPERKKNEHKATYKARVEYERAKFYGEPVSDYSRRRYERKPENIV
jgi:hypothetical protein